MREIKAVWFDLDDTLYDHTYSVCRGMDAVRAQYASLADRDSEELASIYNRALNIVYPAHVRGEIDFREMRRRKLKLFYPFAGLSESQIPPVDEFHRIYDEAYCRHRRAVPGSIEVLRQLGNEGMALAILTNSKQSVQEEKLRIIGLDWMIPNLLTAERAGFTKPDPRLYRWALEQTGQRAADVLMVGDSLENDVEAALRCGLNAVLYNPSATQRYVATARGTAPVISNWSALFDLIGDCRTLGTTG
jgi:putative hydrolase of the HAD superfamily